MFQELMPLLSQRVLIITLSRVTEEEVCLNVIPKALKSDRQDDDAALTTPLAVTGTPKELDEQLPRQLVEFVEAHLGLSSTLKSAKEQMESVAKAAREAAKKSTNLKSHSGSSRSAGDSQPSAEPTQATATEAGAIGAGASARSLFDPEPKNDK
jgi:PRTRC genetic system protein E